MFHTSNEGRSYSCYTVDSRSMPFGQCSHKGQSGQAFCVRYVLLEKKRGSGYCHCTTKIDELHDKIKHPAVVNACLQYTYLASRKVFAFIHTFRIIIVEGRVNTAAFFGRAVD